MHKDKCKGLPAAPALQVGAGLLAAQVYCNWYGTHLQAAAPPAEQAAAQGQAAVPQAGVWSARAAEQRGTAWVPPALESPVVWNDGEGVRKGRHVSKAMSNPA